MGLSRELKRKISNPNISDEEYNALLLEIKKQAPECEFLKINKPRNVERNANVENEINQFVDDIKKGTEKTSFLSRFYSKGKHAS